MRESTLHHSDSGADLSESSRDLDWEKYWATNGERLIWESWISKYGDYIDPNYLHSFNNRESERFHDDETSYFIQFNESKNNDKRISFTGFLDDIDKKNKDESIEISSTNEPVFNNCVSAIGYDGCANDTLNDVGSLSILVRRSSDTSESCKSDSGRSDNGSNGEEVRLSSGSRCSGNSFALTATTDSMTNVTRMTISSSDSVTDESSARSNSFVSSSNSQCDGDQQWQQLWMEHFNEQYYAHYQAFAKQNKAMKIDDNYIQEFFSPNVNNMENSDDACASKEYIADDDDYNCTNEKSDLDSSEQVTCILKSDNQMDSSSDCPDVSNLHLDESSTSAETHSNKERPIKKLRSKNRRLR